MNRAAVRGFGFADPEQIIGERINFPNNQNYEVVGVVDDFLQSGMHSAVEPISIQLDSTDGGSFISVNVSGNVVSLIEVLEKEYKQLFPKTPFEYRFLDQSYREQYEADLKFQQIFNFFTLVAIFIACLGLLGLSAFFVNQRKKEISIRKVLGASKGLVLKLLLKEYWQLIAIAATLSIPLA